MSSQRQPTPTYGEHEREAWEIVLEAIEEAMDVEGLSLWDRGRLAELHSQAGWYIGRPQLTVPDEWTPRPLAEASAAAAWLRPAPGASAATRARLATLSARADIAYRAGGTVTLVECGLNADLASKLAFRYKLATIAEIEQLSDTELLSLDGIGAKRLAMIRAAVTQWRAQTTTVVA